MIDVQLPDGRVVKVDVNDPATARQAAAQLLADERAGNGNPDTGSERPTERWRNDPLVAPAAHPSSGGATGQRADSAAAVHGPWEKYQRQEQPAGPWTKYQRQEQPAAPWTKYQRAQGSGGSWRDAPIVQPPQPARRAPAPAPEPAPAPAPAAAEPSTLDSILRGLQIGTQGVGELGADVLGTPGDILSMLGNVLRPIAGQTVGNVVGSIFPTSEALKQGAGDALRSAGVPIIPESEMSPMERIAKSINEYGAGAALGSAGAIRAAGSGVGAALSEGSLPLIPRDVAEAATRGTAGKTFFGDTLSGAAAGGSLQGFRETNADDALREYFGPAGETIGNLAATLAGGVTGNLAARAASAGRGAALSAARAAGEATGALPARPDARAIDPLTGKRFSKSVLDTAGYLAQREADNPISARGRILDRLGEILHDESLASAGRPTPSEIPTVGALSGDQGLASLEKTARTVNEAPFRSRDAARANLLRRTVESVAPEGDGRAFTQEFERRAAARRGAASERVRNAEGAESEFARARRAAGDELAAEGASGPSAARTLDEILTGDLREAQRRKNAAAAAIDPGGTVQRNAGFLQEAANAAEARSGALNDPGQSAPVGLIQRIRSLGEFDPKTGEMLDPGTVTVRDLQAIKPEISDAIAAARREQRYQLADSLTALRRAIDEDTARLAQEGTPAGQRAREFQRVYREEFAPLFARGPGDEATRFRQDFNLDRTNRTTTPPSETAGRFLRPASPEKAQSLARILRASPRGAEGRAAARQFLLGDLVQGGVIDPQSGAINRVKLGKWRQRWGDEGLEVAAPGLVRELDTVASRAASDESTAARLAREARAARDAAHLTETEIKKGALGFALGRSPEKAIDAVMQSGDPGRNMAAVVREIGDDELARTGLKQAVREWLLDNATNTESGIGQGRPVSLGKLSNLFEKRVGALAEVFTPEEMNKLRQVHRILEDDQIVKAAKALAGSDTTPRGQNVKKLEGALEGALKAKFGVLKGGGMMRIIKIWRAALSSDSFNNKLNRAIAQMMLDPELAAHLLVRDVHTAPAWNRRLQQLLGVTESVRATGEDGQGGPGR